MGANTDRSSQPLIVPVNENGGTADRGSRTGSRTPDTETDRGGGRTGGTGRTADGENPETVKTEKVDGLSLLTEEEKQQFATASEDEQKRLLRNAKRRERYAKQKQNNGESVKPRKVKNSNKNSNNQAFDVAQLNLILAGISTAVASRPNNEHWLLSESEINSITVPLAKMLAESETFANMGQYSNQIALVMACMTVIAPRVFITLQKQKEVKRIERTGQQTDTNVRGTKNGTVGKAKDSDSNARGNHAERNQQSNDKHDVQSVPFYGLPIA